MKTRLRLFLILFLSAVFLNGFGAIPEDHKNESISFQTHSSPDTIKKELKNNVYPGISLGLMWGSMTINYERKLFSAGENSGTTGYLRAAYGEWSVWGAEGNGAILSLNMIPSSKKGSHIEFGLGCAMLVFKEQENHDYPPEEIQPQKNETHFYPEVNLGYRYQHPYKHFFFRFGAAFPEGVYMGMGVHF